MRRSLCINCLSRNAAVVGCSRRLLKRFSAKSGACSCAVMRCLCRMEFPCNWKPFPSLTPGSLSCSRGSNAQVRCWEIAANGTSVAKAQQSYSQPLLCSSWAADGSTVYTGGCDHQVAAWNLATNQSQVLLPLWSPPNPHTAHAAVFAPSLSIRNSSSGTLRFSSHSQQRIPVALPGFLYVISILLIRTMPKSAANNVITPMAMEGLHETSRSVGFASMCDSCRHFCSRCSSRTKHLLYT